MHVYPEDEYRNMRLFTTPDGKAGFALKGDDMVSLFKHPESDAKKFANTAMALAINQGGRRLDAFDTVLPRMYAGNGFRAVARLPWNDEYKPDDWSYDTFKEFNGGRPDVVFMVYDPVRAQAYKQGDGPYVADYDAGTAAQQSALKIKEWDESKHPRAPAGSSEGGQFIGDDELGSMALGGEDRNVTASTKKVDALREEMGVSDIPFKQRQALDMYTQDSFTFNQNARGGPGPVAPETGHLDELVGSHELPRDVTVYRTVGWQRTQSILNNEGSFSDPGFMSATLDKSKIDKPGSYIEIQVPKGSRAFPVGSLSNYPEEAEILFPRDSRLQIISHEPRDAPNTERFVARLVS